MTTHSYLTISSFHKIYAGILLAVSILLFNQSSLAQAGRDSTQHAINFSGSIGLTNNGFSIIPSFSLNSPAAIVQLSWRKNKCSFDPDVRITPDYKKGSMLFWFRYHAIENKKFSLRIGMHPAFNWMPATVTEAGVNKEWIRLRRFFAWEVSPGFRINQKWKIGLYYLQGNGLQNHGPQTTHFVNLNAGISPVKLSQPLTLSIFPAFYYLYLDRQEGTYFTATIQLKHQKWPLALQSIINQTFRSNISGNQIFMWNIGVQYEFKKKLL